MKKLASRRLRNNFVLCGFALAAVLASAISTSAIRDTPRNSGWVLLSLIVFLTLYNVRKKLAFMPFGSSATWLQLHIYVGLFTSLVFGIHISWHLPSGVFESVLALLYAAVFLSGIVGLVVSRSFAKRLTTRGEEVLFERIPVVRKRLESEVEAIVLSTLEQSASTTIAHFYVDRLKPFFAESRHGWQHLLQSSRPRQALLNDIKAYQRYLDESEQETMRKIASRVRKKDDLDYQFALQAALKYWLFAHVPLSYALLVFAVFHLLLVYAFSGSAS